MRIIRVKVIVGNKMQEIKDFGYIRLKNLNIMKLNIYIQY